MYNHHNFARQERHFDETYWVVRKGCTAAFPSQRGFFGANMVDNSFIIEGVDSNLYSVVHGAGRTMSRRVAAGKIKWMKNKTGIKKPTIIAKVRLILMKYEKNEVQ